MAKVSVIIPCYNHAEYVAETIESVLAQDYQDVEVIVGDDASTDNSAEVIKSFGGKVRPFFFKKNRGYFATVQDLFKEVRGEYVQIFSSDDLYLPGYLSASMKLMLDEKLKLTCSDIRYFSPSDSRETSLHPSSKPTAFHKEQVVQTFRNSDFWVPGVACITEIHTLKKYGLPDPRMENISDWYLFHKIALLEGIGYLPQVGIAMRETEASYTNQVKKDRKRRNATYWAVLDEVSKDRELRSKFRDSRQLTFILDNLFWKLIGKPQWWDFFWHSRSSVPRRLLSSVQKRLSF